MAEFVWASIGGNKPQLAELCWFGGQRVIFTLDGPPDQFFPDDPGSGVKIMGSAGKPKHTQQRVGVPQLQFHSDPVIHHRSKDRRDLRGGLDCGIWQYGKEMEQQTK